MKASKVKLENVEVPSGVKDWKIISSKKLECIWNVPEIQWQVKQINIANLLHKVGTNKVADILDLYGTCESYLDFSVQGYLQISRQIFDFLVYFRNAEYLLIIKGERLDPYGNCDSDFGILMTDALIHIMKYQKIIS